MTLVLIDSFTQQIAHSRMNVAEIFFILIIHHGVNVPPTSWFTLLFSMSTRNFISYNVPCDTHMLLVVLFT